MSGTLVVHFAAETLFDQTMSNPNETAASVERPLNFLEEIIEESIARGDKRVQTRFPPEPNGYLHIGHAKSICLNFGLAKKYGGLCNLRFDDTNPVKEDVEYVDSIKEDVRWLGFEWAGEHYASDYFDQLYEWAKELIKKGLAYVDDQTQEQIRQTRGTVTVPGTESPWRNRSVEENLDLFERMRAGEFGDGEKVLRAKIDMAHPNMLLRDPIMYRILHSEHHRTGNKWCIYPMYDFAHPIEDAIEGITHSICTLEFEDHRPLYDWVVRELEYKPYPPRQIEFAKLYLTNVVTGKRYIKKLVEQGIVDGWDDPRLVSIAALRRRGFTPESIKLFVDLCGISKSNSSVDYAMLEYCIREDLKLKRARVMAVVDPVKLVIDNYPEDQIEYLDAPNNLENEALGSRKVPFGRELYIEREDFMEEPPKKYFRMFPGNEVRLMNAYFVTCTGCEKDENGNVTVIHGTYDPATKSGSGFEGRKVKGTIHWVACQTAVKATVRLYENIIDEEKGVYNEDGSLNLNPNSLTVKEAWIEPSLKDAKPYESFQFVRQGYFCVDYKDSKPGEPVFNRIVSLKSSFKLPKKD